MKIEKNDKIELIEKIQESLIYFLIDGEEVVYVGQSSIGLQRPYSHSDKIFNRIAILRCDSKELDELESKYIRKYSPKYNKQGICGYDYTIINARTKIKQFIRNQRFSNAQIRKYINQLNIKTYFIGGYEHIYVDDLNRMLQEIAKSQKP